MALIDWSAREVEKVADDSARAGKPNPATGCNRTPNRFCQGCPQANQTGHLSYGYGWPTAQLADEQRIQLSTFRTLRYAVWRIGRMLTGLMGWQPGFRYNAEASNNFADFQSWVYAPIGPRRLNLVLQSLADPRNVPIASKLTVEPEVGINKFTRTFYGVAIQPGDIIQFDPPSVLAFKSRPTVLGIVAFDPETNIVTVDVDQDISAALYSYDRTTSEVLSFWSCRSWREAGDPEKWERITPATPHYGKQRRVRIEAADIPANGRVRLQRTNGTDCAIATPRLSVPAINQAQSFRVVAVESDGSPTDITATILAGGYRAFRVKTVTNQDGTAYTELCLGTTDHTGNTVFSDLRPNRLAFIVDFVAEATAAEQAAGDFEVWAYDRCRYAARDWSGTIGFLRDPETGGAAGGWYCSKAMAVTRVPIFSGGLQTGETVSFTPIEAGPRFPNNGRCAQCGTCAGFAPLEYSDEPNARPFGLPILGRIIREIWNGVSVRFDQLFPGLASFRNILVKRPADGHTSLSELAGMPDLTSFPGMHPRTDFPRNASGVAAVDIVEEDGNEYLVPIRGAWWDLDHEFAPGYEYGQQTGFPNPGHYGTNTANWDQVRDPINGEESLSDAKDLSHSYRSQLPRQNSRAVRDTGEVSGAGHSSWGRANAQPGYLLAPQIPNRPGQYDREDAIVTIHAEPVPVFGLSFMAKMTIQVRPARTFRKQEAQLVTATILSATMNGSDCEIEIALGTDQWSVIAGDPGQRFDDIRKVLAGGNFCDAPDWEQNRDYYATNKWFGAQQRARRGDHVSFSGTGFSDLRFPIVTARAHGGTEQDNWGEDRRQVAGLLTGFFAPDESNMAIGTDPVTGNTIYGQIRVRPQYLAPDTAISSDTVIRLVLQGSATGISLLIGARLRVADTGEMMTVTAATFTANSPEVVVTVLRGQFGTTAREISEDYPIYWETVTNAAGQFYQLIEGETRPTSIAANQYWQDPITGNLIVGSAQTDFVIQYSVQGDPNPPATSRAYSEEWTSPAMATLPIGLSSPDFNNQASDASISWASPETPGVGPLAFGDLSAQKVITAPLLDAGRGVVASFTLEGDATAPTRWGYAPGFSAAKRRDKIVVRDNQAGQLAAIVSQLPGKQITAWQNSGVFLDMPTNKIEWATYRESDWNTGSGSVIADGGRGMFWVDQAGFDSITESVFCLRVQQEEPTP